MFGVIKRGDKLLAKTGEITTTYDHSSYTTIGWCQIIEGSIGDLYSSPFMVIVPGKACYPQCVLICTYPKNGIIFRYYSAALPNK